MAPVPEKAKVRWPHDVMRHSHGSYHLAQYEDAEKTALQMGHTSTVILFNHYSWIAASLPEGPVAEVLRTEAGRCWDISPCAQSAPFRA